MNHEYHRRAVSELETPAVIIDLPIVLKNADKVNLTQRTVHHCAVRACGALYVIEHAVRRNHFLGLILEQALSNLKF